MSPELYVEAAAAAGYAAGIVADQIAVRMAARTETAALPIWEQAADGVEPQSRSFAYRAGHFAVTRLLAPTALVLGAASGIETAAWVPGTTQDPSQPTVELLVDHSGATAHNLQHKPVIKQINTIAGQFNSPTSNIKATTASAGEFREMSISEVANDPATGPAPLPDALTNVLSKLSSADRATATSKAGERSVVVITNGNAVGNPTAVAHAAQTAYTHVYVVNVEAKQQQNPQITNELMTIAKQTKGQYWEADQANAKNIADQVQATVTPNQRRDDNPYRVPLAALGGMGALGAAGFFARRKKYTFGRGVKGE